MNESFDENRFTALLDLVGPLSSLELAERLDEDLTRVAQAIDQAGKSGDHGSLRTQSHVLLAIAGTIGATRLHEVSQRLNALMRTCETTNVADLLLDLMISLEEMITRIRQARSDLMLQT